MGQAANIDFSFDGCVSRDMAVGAASGVAVVRQAAQCWH